MASSDWIGWSCLNWSCSLVWAVSRAWMFNISLCGNLRDALPPCIVCQYWINSNGSTRLGKNTNRYGRSKNRGNKIDLSLNFAAILATSNCCCSLEISIPAGQCRPEPIQSEESPDASSGIVLLTWEYRDSVTGSDWPRLVSTSRFQKYLQGRNYASPDNFNSTLPWKFWSREPRFACKGNIVSYK